MTIQTELAFRLDVDLAAPLYVGKTYAGERRVIPIVGGTFVGKRIRGNILPGGADWNVVRSDSVVHLWARYTIQTDDDVNIMITNEGLQRGPADTMERILTGQPFEQGEWYAKTRPVFEVDHPKYAWLNQAVFVGELLVPSNPMKVSIEIHEVL